MRSRRGFTLVEMLVATALTIFIMVILSQAFVAAMETFRQLKGIGDLESSLRTAATMLRRDLAADHFEGKRRLSDSQFWSSVGPPSQGYLRIQQDKDTIGDSDLEKADADGLPSRRRTGHKLALTVKLRGNNRLDFFSAKISDPDPNATLVKFGFPDARYQQAGIFSSQWAEVAYFLWRDPSNPITANATPLYNLYRRQRLAVPYDNADPNWGNPAVDIGRASFYSQISVSYGGLANPDNAGKLYFNSPADLTIPERRFGMTSTPGSFGLPVKYLPVSLNGKLTGDDLLLTNVVSFDIQVLPARNAPDFVDLKDLTPGAFIFDTWSTIKDDVYDYANTPVPATYYKYNGVAGQGNLFAIRVTMRVWDPRTEQTRQISVIQDL
jgi:prepilin-type N-terminal cleavage/methylation domain-containing protein